MNQSILHKVTQEINDTLEAVITIGELKEAVRKGKNKKAPEVMELYRSSINKIGP
jgi:uncharacterized protein (DUF39 family)